MTRFALFFAVTLLAGTAGAANEAPGRPQQGTIALVGGTAHPVSGAPIPDAAVVFSEGRLVYVGPSDAMPRLAEPFEMLDVAGKHIYPGLIDAATTMGLVEIPAVRATRDHTETGSVNPNARADVAVNPDSEIIPTTRANGILIGHVHPTGGLIAGRSAVMMFDGWTYEEMTLLAPAGHVLNWPNMLPRQGWFIETPVEEQLRERDESLRRVEDLFDQASRYHAAREADGPQQPIDARLEAMRELVAGQSTLYVFANEQTQITAAVAFALRRGLRPVIVGGADAGKCAPLLAENDVPVILVGVHRLPGGRDEAYDEPFALPAQLRESGVRFAIASNREPAFARNLPYHAGTAAAFGLSDADALASITLWPAQILGVGDRVGSLEVGKEATLIVADGDILETPTHVEAAWITGRAVQLTSRHTRLRDKYEQRYAD